MPAVSFCVKLEGRLSHLLCGNGLDVTHDFDPTPAWINSLRACVRCGQADEVKVVDATFGHELRGHVTSILDWSTATTRASVSTTFTGFRPPPPPPCTAA